MHVVLWAALGILAGAAANHLADRLPQHRSLRPGPECPACGAPYAPRQRLALLAWAAADLSCRKCGAPSVGRRRILEAWLALAFAALAWRHGLTWGLVAASFHATVLSLVTVTDLETRLVPNLAVLPAMVLSLAGMVVTCLPCARSMLLGGAVGFGLFFLLWAIYPKGMGFGDVKLAGYIGLVAGYPRVLPCLLVTIVSGGLAALILLVTRRVGRRSYIPYAPFLALGGALALFL